MAQLEQEITREHGLLQQARQRLCYIEAMHQRMAQSLIDERDEARQDAERQQKEIKRLRDMLRRSHQRLRHRRRRLRRRAPLSKRFHLPSDKA